MKDSTMYNISKYGVPREMVSCPGCGRMYGHHNTKVCIACEECSSCCSCESSDLVLAEGFIYGTVLALRKRSKTCPS